MIEFISNVSYDVQVQIMNRYRDATFKRTSSGLWVKIPEGKDFYNFAKENDFYDQCIVVNFTDSFVEENQPKAWVIIILLIIIFTTIFMIMGV